MPDRPLTPCIYPGCPALVVYPKSRCPAHIVDESLRFTARWYRERRAYLSVHERCAVCSRIATEVDHNIAYRGDAKLFFDQSNWVALCKSCHSHKTATQDGGFGNAPYLSTRRRIIKPSSRAADLGY